MFDNRFVGMGAFAKASESCIGGEWAQAADGSSSMRECCPSDTWNNQQYAHIKGEESVLCHNEARMARVFQLLKPEKIDDFAWDHGQAHVDPNFLNRIARAEYNFFILNPPDRWKRVPGIAHGACDTYDVWAQEKVKHTPQVAAALRDVAAGKSYDKWYKLRDQVTSTVPYSAPWYNVTARPKSIEELLVVKNGEVEPTAWVSELLGVYAPISLASKAKYLDLKSSHLKLSSLPRVQLRKLGDMRDKQLMSQNIDRAKLINMTETEDGRWSTSTKIAVGVGAAAIVGVGAYVYFIM